MKKSTFAKVRFVFLFAMGLLCMPISAQSGSTGVFSILKMLPNARTNAWGGYCNAYRTGDASMFMNNPALLGTHNHNQAVLNFNTQFPGVWSGNAAYALKYKDVGNFAAGVSFVNYGNMDAYDAGGNAEGQVSANESVFALGYSKQINSRLSVGASAKVAYSILAGYVANGFGLDLGAVYTKKDSVLSAAFVIKNAGVQFIHYRDTRREPMPFQMEVGINFKPKHMPFRFNIVYHNLQRFDLTYSQYLADNNIIDLSGKPTVAKKASIGDQFLRHLTVGTELVLGKNFGILVGYNHQRRKEMAPADGPGVTGYSWGLHLKISKFNITYSSAAYFPGFATNLFTFSANLSDFKKKIASSQSPVDKKN